MEKIRIGIVVSEFNYDITMMMLQRATEYANFLSVDVHKVFQPNQCQMQMKVK